jgi:hypothetical protein
VPDVGGAVDMGIGGVGGAYFLASPGQLIVDVEKRDRNLRGRRTHLQALLLGPDRHVLDKATIPDDGQPRGTGLGPPGRVRLSTQVKRKGVYALNVTVSQDRYGDEIVWGIKTNCPHYLIETSRGHRDERHQEPIVLLRPDRPGNVCFLPQLEALRIDVSDVPQDVDALSVYDANDSLIRSLPVDTDGRTSHTFPAGVHRDAMPWRLHLPAQRATVQIDGVTRWQRGDLHENLSLWTPDPASYFPLPDYRWLLTPYSRNVYGQPGSQGEVVFQAHNNSAQPKTIRLAMEFPQGPWPAELSTDTVRLGSRKAANVVARYTVPPAGESRVCHVRATPKENGDFTTYSTLTVNAGTAPASQPLKIPVQLRPYQHENEQFGYLPDYPTQSQLYFDQDNRPLARVSGGVAALRDGQWMTSELRTSVVARSPHFGGTSFGTPSTKLAFDSDNDLYLVTTSGTSAVLLHSRDGGSTFAAYVIPGREGQPRAFDIEQFSGHNTPEGPPPVLRYTRTAKDPRLFWRRVHDLELFLPVKTNDGLSIPKPIPVSHKCIGLAAHSGIPATVVSHGRKVHVIWAEATDPDERVPGVPTYVATYDRETCTMGEPALVGYGAPPNDIHNTPSITIDSRGYLHALAGTHGQPFQYARSRKPNDAHAGWTAAEPVGEGLRQTYIGLVCGHDNTLHLVFRLWRFGTPPYPDSHHATLAYMRKRPGQPWEAPRLLIVSAFSEYSVFYHRLTIDAVGRLFLSYDYWSTYWFYRNDHRGDRRSVLMSADGGDTWKLVGASDLQPSSK